MDELFEKLKKIEGELLDAKNERLYYMPKGQMRFIEQKCENNKLISKADLYNYAKAFSCEEKITNLKSEKDYLEFQIDEKIKVIKEYTKNRNFD